MLFEVLVFCNVENLYHQMDEMCNELHVLSVTDETPVVRVDPIVKDVRPYLVCGILQKLDLSGENFKKFISLQVRFCYIVV